MISKAMSEIHEIMERKYEQEKNLSRQQRISKIHQEAEELVKKYKLQLKRNGVTKKLVSVH